MSLLDALRPAGALILAPLYYLISAVLVGWHRLFTETLGLSPSGGTAWVLSIVGLTLVVRTALIPLFVRQIRASRSLQLLQPRVRELQTRYGADRERLARETMTLYREAGTSPFASCLPILLQMPVFLALFRLLDQAAKRGQGHGVLTDALARGFGDATLFGGVPISATFLSLEGMLGVQVVAAVLVLVMAASTFLTQRQLALPRPRILYAVPLVLAVGGLAFPIGVLVYWTTSSLWTLGQQLYVVRSRPGPGTRLDP